jgi:hypothetical protein
MPGHYRITERWPIRRNCSFGPISACRAPAVKGLYQEGTLKPCAVQANSRLDAEGDELPIGTAIFYGTLAVHGALGAADGYELEIEDLMLGRKINHRYSVPRSHGVSDMATTFGKPHLEFHTLDLSAGWHSPPGYPDGIKQKILASNFDEAKKVGGRSRLLRFEAGVFTTEPFVHDYWEEVYLISGDLTVGNDANGNGGTEFEPNTYACRPPGAVHGPFKSKSGCLLFELHYFSNDIAPPSR